MSFAKDDASINLSTRSDSRLKHTTQIRSATAFEFRNHHSYQSIQNNLASNYIIGKNKRYGSSLALQRPYPRSRSTVNFVRRPYSAVFRSESVTKSFDQDDSSFELNNKPKRSLLTLTRIGMVYFGIEVLFSLEIALTVPILLKLKVPDQIYSLVYFLSPLIGFIFQPVLGVMSDRCQSRFGRRRPFIFILSIFAFIGIGLILNAYLLGQQLGDKYTEVPKIAILLVGLGVTFLDFSADSSDSPLRAFLLDVCNPEDQDTGLNIHAFLGGAGGAVGYILGAIDWTNTFLNFIGDEMQILFVFASIIFLSTLFVTITSVKETPLVLDDLEHLPLLDGNSKSSDNITNLPEEFLFDESESVETKKNEKKKVIQSAEDSLDDDVDRPVTITMLYQSVLKMPKELIRLLICNLFGWLAFFSTSLFFTDFVGQAIYHGDASAQANSTSFELYNDGVKMGCWCLLTYSVMSAISAVIMEKFLLDRFSTKTLYFFSYFIYAICCIAIYFQTNIYIIMPLSSSIGILLTAISTLPYQMLSDFHKDKNYRNKSAAGTKRGLGIDSFMSIVTAHFGNYSIVVIGAVISLAGCFWISLFVIFPEEEKTQENKSSIAQFSTKSEQNSFKN